MMRKCAVIIGVNKTGGLPILSAAVTGAKEFGNWATSQQFDVALHTDESAPVTIEQIKNTVKGFVNERVYSLMVIFFAGHGILKSATDEQWLLSGAPDDANEAVNVQPSRFMARITGIPHVVFISDACRSIPSDLNIMRVSGAVIFPNTNTGNTVRTDVDMFYATFPGNPAYEVKQDEAVRNYKGIYTDCLLKGLRGEVPELIKAFTASSIPKWVIMPYELDQYLRKVVPLAAQEKSIMLNQDPDGEITSHPPKYLVEFDKQPAIVSDVITRKFNKKPISVSHQPSFEKLVNRAIEESVDNLIKAKGRVSFETRTGFTVIGSREFEPVAGHGTLNIFEENEVMQIRVSPEGEGAYSLLLKLKDGRSTPLAVLPGFIGTVLIENDQVVNVNYTPSRGTKRYEEMLINGEDLNLDERRAKVIAAARFGKFRPTGSSESLMREASYLRHSKAFDPTLGLYAAYAYAQAGDYRAVKSVYDYMAREPEPVLFDVAMLKMLFEPESEIGDTSPSCPLLTQGWSYLSINYKIFPNILRELSSHLLPGLWTTFNPKGTEIFENFITQKKEK